jgi:hypothetical protein
MDKTGETRAQENAPFKQAKEEGPIIHASQGRKGIRMRMGHYLCERSTICDVVRYPLLAQPFLQICSVMSSRISLLGYLMQLVL